MRLGLLASKVLGPACLTSNARVISTQHLQLFMWVLGFLTSGPPPFFFSNLTELSPQAQFIIHYISGLRCLHTMVLLWYYGAGVSPGLESYFYCLLDLGWPSCFNCVGRWNHVTRQEHWSGRAIKEPQQFS